MFARRWNGERKRQCWRTLDLSEPAELSRAVTHHQREWEREKERGGVERATRAHFSFKKGKEKARQKSPAERPATREDCNNEKEKSSSTREAHSFSEPLLEKEGREKGRYVKYGIVLTDGGEGTRCKSAH